MTQTDPENREHASAGGSLPAGTEAQGGLPASETAERAAVFENVNHGAASALSSRGGRPWTPEERELLEEWTRRVKAAQHAHYFLMGRLERRNVWLGIPVVIVTAIVGTSAFATLSGSERVPSWIRALVGVVSLSASILAATQTFLRFAQRAQEHGLAADWFSAVRRDMEVLRSIPETDRGAPKKTLDALRQEINRVVQHAPRIGETLWHRFAERYNVKEPLESSRAR